MPQAVAARLEVVKAEAGQAGFAEEADGESSVFSMFIKYFSIRSVSRVCDNYDA
jgi:hypothetical protein